MPQFEASHFRSTQEYTIAAETFARLTGLLLFGFGEGAGSVKNQVIKNFIARTVKTVRAVMALWELGDIQNCWILHRCLLDRFFHLVDLGKTMAYDVFDDWSFMRQFEAQNRVRSDTSCKDLLDSPLFKPSPEQRARYAALAKSPPQWRRPKAEDVAKGMGFRSSTPTGMTMHRHISTRCRTMAWKISTTSQTWSTGQTFYLKFP